GRQRSIAAATIYVATIAICRRRQRLDRGEAALHGYRQGFSLLLSDNLEAASVRQRQDVTVEGALQGGVLQVGRAGCVRLRPANDVQMEVVPVPIVRTVAGHDALLATLDQQEMA